MKLIAITAKAFVSDIEDVVAEVLKLTHRAGDEGAEIVLFPEVTLGHYFRGPVSLEGPELTELRQLARQRKLSLGIGVGEIDGESLYSSYALIGPEGSLSVHRKTRWQTARCPISLGDKAVAHSLSGVSVGIMVCSEAKFPEVGQSLADDGAQLLIVPACLGLAILPEADEQPLLIEDFWQEHLVEHARRTGLPVLSVAASGMLDYTADGMRYFHEYQGGCALIDAGGRSI